MSCEKLEQHFGGQPPRFMSQTDPLVRLFYRCDTYIARGRDWGREGGRVGGWEKGGGRKEGRMEGATG